MENNGHIPALVQALKSQITLKKIQKGKSLIKWKSPKLNRMDNNCHFPDLVQAFSYEENCTAKLMHLTFYWLYRLLTA